MQVPMLIVDDEPLIIEVLQKILHSSGYETITARDGYEAIKIVKKRQILIAILDLKLPRLNGIEVLKRWLK